MKKLIRNILEFVSSLNKTQKLLGSIALLIVLIFLVNSISNVSFKETFIDYKHVSANDLVETSAISTDRDIYLILEEIVSNFLNTNLNKYEIDGKKVSLRDYYDYALYTEYKYNMSYGKFKKKANAIYDKVYFYKNQKYTNIPLEEIIDTIYLYSESRGMYIVKINTNSDLPAYIGIELDDINEKYSIFYLE